MRIAVYVRARGTNQWKKVFAQSGEIRKWAAEHGHKIYDEYRDVGESGSDPCRYELGSMLSAAILRRSFDAIVVTDYSRLSRDPETFSRMLSALGTAGVSVISMGPALTGRIKKGATSILAGPYD